MVSSKAATPDAYVAQLPSERAAVVSRVRDLVNANLPTGYLEVMAFGMIGWVVPLSRYPDTYNGEPAVYAGLAAQKNYFSLYLTCVYASEARRDRLRAGFAAAGKTLDMGKSCIRFKRMEDLADAAIAEAIAGVPVETFIAVCKAPRSRS
jgi:hypothetical protein